MIRDRRPLPVQIRDELLESIRDQRLVVGDRLPSEPELAERTGVARTTVREALKLLQKDGLIEVRPGQGWYVAPLSALAPIDRPITRLESVTDMLRSLGLPVTERLLGVTVRMPTAEEAEALDLSNGLDVVQVQRLRLLEDGTPLVLSSAAMPRDLLPDSPEGIDWSRSILEILDGWGHRIVASVAQIQAGGLPTTLARRVSLPPGTPCLILTQRNVSESGRCVLYSRDHYRGDRFSFNVFRRRDG